MLSKEMKIKIENRQQLRIEVNLIIMLMEICPDCLLCLGVEERYVIATVLFKGNFALSRIVNCSHIHRVIKESGKSKMYPKEVFEKMCEKGLADYVE